MLERKHHGRGRWLRGSALVGAAALAAVAAAAGASSARSGGQSAAQQKIAAPLSQQLAKGGQTRFWVVFKAHADLSAAPSIKRWGARGTYVMKQLQATAAASQGSVKALLNAAGTSYHSFWIANTMRVTGTKATADAIASLPEVESVVPDKTIILPKLKEGHVDTPEWNLVNIRAPEVWAGFGDRGEGIVVANIDTGVQWDHPALVSQYRGHRADGSVDHNYNWYDPSNVCGTPSLVPCDNVFHGTHTMGTMVGDDGGDNQVGVAPGAKWIAAKGCESSSCTLEALLASGQWVLAPTDLTGNNPRPDLRPNIVNNSWGDGPTDPFYEATVSAWVASGIFPQFSNGNAGPSCQSSGVPGAYPESYSAGAYDINNVIADFSSRGSSSFFDGLKPNISAPGVNVRSSVPGNGYDFVSGTSMASPHVAGTVALMWSAAPSLIGDIPQTEQILNESARDTSDLSCGGDPGNNNVYGEGRLDAFAAVDASPRGPTGHLVGTVTDSATGDPVAGATVHAVGPDDRSTTTDSDGTYDLRLPVGTYSVTASAFGYVTHTVDGVEITEDSSTTQDFALEAAPSGSLHGHVVDNHGHAVSGATVTINGTPIPPATTDHSGSYSFDSVPNGEYDVTAGGDGCLLSQTDHVTVSGDTTHDFGLAHKVDGFGYSCQSDDAHWIAATDPLPLSGDDSALDVPLPFLFTFYGDSFDLAHVATNGYLSFTTNTSFAGNGSIPSADDPNGAIYPFWDDLVIDATSAMYTQAMGAAPHRQFVIEWRNAAFFGDLSQHVNVEVILGEDGSIVEQMQSVNGDLSTGSSATIGIENAAGDDGIQYSFNAAIVSEGGDRSITYTLPPSGFLQGTVTDANDHLALAGATVTVTQGGNTIRTMTTNEAGQYRTQVPLGSYTVTASKDRYESRSASAKLKGDNPTVTRDFALRTARAVVTGGPLDFVVTPGESRTATLTLSNTGSLDMTWEIKESGGGGGAVVHANALHKRAKGYRSNTRTTRGLFVGGAKHRVANPDTPGDVIKSFSTSSLELAWGVGFQGNVWFSDIPNHNDNVEFTTDGAPTGRSQHADWAGVWPGDMAYNSNNNSMCQVNVGGDNGIYCWNLDTGAVVGAITSGPFTGISQRGLAYNPADDTFYVGGWNEGIIYHVKGLSYPDPGAAISQCNAPDFNISGLAYNGAANVLWEATNSDTDTIYEVDPATCNALATLAHPSPGFNGAGIEMDDSGNLWTVSQNDHTAYLIDSGVPAFNDVPWLSEDPSSGTLAAGASQPVQVTIDTAGLAPGLYTASLFFVTNSGRVPTIRVPVSVLVSGYRKALNAGGAAYTDGNEDVWQADQKWTKNGYGYYNKKAKAISTATTIKNTTDQALYQDARENPLEYRFSKVPSGVYEVDLRYAEIQGAKPYQRLFDVIAERTLEEPAFDIAGEVGKYNADQHTYFVNVTDGTLNVRLIPRGGYLLPIINAIRVTHRPDMH